MQGFEGCRSCEGLEIGRGPCCGCCNMLVLLATTCSSLQKLRTHASGAGSDVDVGLSAAALHAHVTFMRSASE